MGWVLVAIAGLLEVAWATGLKYTEGFTKLVPSIFTILAIVVSMWLLAWAARTLPIGTAYAVWVGIGAAGTAIMGVVLFAEPMTFARIFFLALLVVSVIGLRLSS